MELKEQNNFRGVIEKRLAEVETEISDATSETGAVAPDTAIGRLSRLDALQIQEMALATRNRLEAEKLRLHDALHRIDHGDYGRCALCRQDIALERLRFQPDAVLCVPCAQKRK